jgi:probable HAF family extracellular repeat protein
MRYEPLVVVVLALNAASADAASFTPLGTIPGGIGSVAWGVSSDGGIVVGAALTDWGSEAFRWSNGVMTGLGDLPNANNFSVAYGVSADGSVVVGSGADTEAFRWEGGSMTGLGDLPGGDFSSAARGVSGDGGVIVGYGWGASGTEAVRWSDGVMTGLGDLPGGAFHSVAQGVSADGTVIVGHGTSSAGTEAFRWSGGVMTGLGSLPGAGGSVATAVSASGAVIVGGVGRVGGSEAFRWADGVMVGLGDLPGGPVSSIAYGVSGDGSVVVGYGTTEFGGSDAIVWTGDGGMQRLFDVLVAGGATGLEGWRLFEANAISADGKWIVGTGNRGGNDEAFLAYIAPVPVPAAAWLFASALGGLAWLRRSGVSA